MKRGNVAINKVVIYGIALLCLLVFVIYAFFVKEGALANAANYIKSLFGGTGGGGGF